MPAYFELTYLALESRIYKYFRNVGDYWRNVGIKHILCSHRNGAEPERERRKKWLNSIKWKTEQKRKYNRNKMRKIWNQREATQVLNINIWMYCTYSHIQEKEKEWNREKPEPRVLNCKKNPHKTTLKHPEYNESEI